MTRATRRQPLSEISFGKMDTYTKLDKLGEVSQTNFPFSILKKILHLAHENLVNSLEGLGCGSTYMVVRLS